MRRMVPRADHRTLEREPRLAEAAPWAVDILATSIIRLQHILIKFLSDVSREANAADAFSRSLAWMRARMGSADRVAIGETFRTERVST